MGGKIVRVIVIGSGIAGLSAAIALRKVGVDVTVYERAPELREVGAGISIWANALRALDYLGVGDSIRRLALKMTRSEIRSRNGFKVQMAYTSEQLERKAGLSEIVRMIHRADLVGALASHLPEGSARYGYECIGVDLRGKSAGVRFQNGHSAEADVVIGADGIHSAVRLAILGPDTPRYSGYTCWRGICPRPATLAPGYVAEWWGRGKRLGITTLTDDRVYWWATRNALRDGHEADERAGLQNEFRDWAEPAPTLFATTPADHIFRNDILDRPPNKPWSRGRAGLIGDAAHSTTPNLGQGGCVAIEDSVVLARHVASADDPANALLAFTAERFPRTAAITRESWRFGSLGQIEGRFACWLRDALVGLLGPLLGLGGLLKHAKFDVGPLPAPAAR
jgi:2-polyprenyl-6-methoxyphenol hydroxylase-like FAD-dependent oxidoreductase